MTMSGISSAKPKTANEQLDLFHGTKGGYDHQTWLLQGALKASGLWKGPVDGKFTPEFKAFFVDWQKQAQREAEKNLSTYSQGGGPRGPALDGAPVQVVDPNGISTRSGIRLAEIARKAAAALNTHGWCAKGVGNALATAGYGDIPRVPSAYQKAALLAGDKRFKEISVDASDLDELPPGCIIVWSKNNAHPHGHICVTLGNGMEASDHIAPVMNIGTKPRVFVPN